MRTAVVYQISNIITKRSYIGCTVNFSQRINTHFLDLKAGKHLSGIMNRDYLDYGDKAFKVSFLYKQAFTEGQASGVASELKKIELKKIKEIQPEYNSIKGKWISAAEMERILITEDEVMVMDLIKPLSA